MSMHTVLEKALSKETPDDFLHVLQNLAMEDWDKVRQMLLLLPHDTGVYSPQRPGNSAYAKPTLEYHAAPTPPPAPEQERQTAVPDQALLGGKYLLREQLGVGGMGEVRAADQVTPVRRRVAVKIIKAGLDSHQIVHRFEQERQALALMEHPHIARIFDGGTTPDGKPYFVMEHVKGVSITKYCDHAKLTLRERLELFLPVCQAIQHAHQKGIIHRDLKPSNILVGTADDKPVPKIIDFGVAKAMHGPILEQSVYTELNTIIGTLEYMSPEQAEFNSLDIDTRSDIYSLGVVLYELLAGVLPFNRKEELSGSLEDSLRVIRDVEPLKPSIKAAKRDNLPEIAQQRKLEPAQLPKEVAGELDWIVMKCLEKERERRYSTAADLAADLERFLRDEPVLAAPPSRAYRVKKLLKRHKGKVLVAATILFLLVAGVTATTIGLFQALWAEAKAEQEADIHRALFAFIVQDVFTPMDAWERANLGLSLENDLKLRDVLERAAQKLDRGHLAQQPPIEASLRVTLGKAFLSLGAFRTALKQFDRGDQLRVALYGEEHLQRLEVLEHWANTQGSLLDYSDAEIALNKVLQGRMRLLGPNHPTTLNTQYLLCSLDNRRKKYTGLQDRLTSLVTAQERVLGRLHRETLVSKQLLATVCHHEGDHAKARALLQEALQGLETTVGPEHPDTLAGTSLYGTLLKEKGQLVQAEQQFRKAIAHGTKTLGADHPFVMAFKTNLANCLIQRRQFSAAELLYREALPVFERIDPEHEFTLVVKNNLATIRYSVRDFEGAVKLYESIQHGYVQKQGETHVNSWKMLLSFSYAYFHQGQAEKSIAVVERLLSMLPSQSESAQAADCRLQALQVLVPACLEANQCEKGRKHLRAHLDAIPKDHPHRAPLQKLLADLEPP